MFLVVVQVFTHFKRQDIIFLKQLKVLQLCHYLPSKYIMSLNIFLKPCVGDHIKKLWLTLERPRGGGGIKWILNGHAIGFSDLKFEKLSSNQNETFSTCSLIMSASFDVNWMMSSLMIMCN